MASSNGGGEHPDHLEGNALHKAGSFDAAIAKYRSAIAADDMNHRARHNIALCYQKLGKHADALEAVNRAIGKSPTGKYFKTRGTSYFHLGRHDDADASYDEAKRLGENVDEGKALVAQERARRASGGGARSSGGGGAGAAARTTPSSSNGGGGGDGGASCFVDKDGNIKMSRLGPDGFPLCKLPVPEVRLVSLLSPLALLRLVVFCALVAYLLPLGSPAIATTSWRIFFAASLLAHLVTPALEGAVALPRSLASLPVWLKHFVQSNVIRQDSPAFVLALFSAFSAVPPPALYNLALVPVGATHLFYVLELLSDEDAGPLSSIKFLGSPLAALARYVSNKIEPAAPVAGADRRNKIYRALLQLGAHCEVALFISSIVLLLTPRRNILSVILFGQTLQMRVLFSTYSRASFGAIDAAISVLVRHPRCPAAVSQLYDTVRKGAIGFAKSMLKTQGPSPAAAAPPAGATGGIGGGIAEAAKKCVIS